MYVPIIIYLWRGSRLKPLFALFGSVLYKFNACFHFQCFTINVFSYACMYKDVRAAVDLCHRDGTLKQMVAKDPKR